MQARQPKWLCLATEIDHAGPEPLIAIAAPVAGGPVNAVTALVALIIVVLLGCALAWWILRRRGMDQWIVTYLLEGSKRRTVRNTESVHVLLCIADHYEPSWA